MSCDLILGVVPAFRRLLLFGHGCPPDVRTAKLTQLGDGLPSGRVNQGDLQGMSLSCKERFLPPLSIGFLALLPGLDVGDHCGHDGGRAAREIRSTRHCHERDATRGFDPYADPYRGASRCRIVPVSAHFRNTNCPR
jgi:hypothetical protein